MTEQALTSQPDTASRNIVSERVFDASCEQVFAAWSDPGRLTRWWGPAGFTSTFEVFDQRPGGVWRFELHSPEGVSFPNEVVFVDVRKPERIVFDHVSAPQFRVTATFANEGGKTRLTFRMTFKTAAECDKIRPIAVPANEQNFDRLEAELTRKQVSSN